MDQVSGVIKYDTHQTYMGEGIWGASVWRTGKVDMKKSLKELNKEKPPRIGVYSKHGRDRRRPSNPRHGSQGT